MSTTTILSVGPGKRPEVIESLRNGNRSAPPLWAAIGKRWIGSDFNWLDHPEKLLPLAENPRIPLHQRAVLMMTFDRHYITRTNFARAARDIRKTFADFTWPSGYVNHWPRIAEVLESNPDVDAIGFHMTSVSENPFDGDWNAEIGDQDLLDWSKTFDIYKELDVQKVEMIELTHEQASLIRLVRNGTISLSQVDYERLLPAALFDRHKNRVELSALAEVCLGAYDREWVPIRCENLVRLKFAQSQLKSHASRYFWDLARAIEQISDDPVVAQVMSISDISPAQPRRESPPVSDALKRYCDPPPLIDLLGGPLPDED